MNIKEVWIYRIVLGFLCFCLVAMSLGLYIFYTRQHALESLFGNLKTSELCTSKTAQCGPCSVIIDRARPWARMQQKVKNTVVQVIVQAAQFNWLQPYATPEQGEVAGSGFFINDRGYFITNAHVVSQGKAFAIQVPGLGKERLDVSVVGVCFDRDIALLKVSDDGLAMMRKEFGTLSYLKLGDSNSVNRGDEIMALGYPLAQEGIKSTVGVVSGRESLENRQYIQIDAAINPGSSGGPSLNLAGCVIGINTSGFVGAQNVGYFIPVNELKLALDDLFACEQTASKIVRKPLLGIVLNQSSPAMAQYLGNAHAGGIYVSCVFKGSVFDRAGVKKGDILCEINGHAINSYGELKVEWSEEKIPLENYAFYLKTGAPVSVVLYRGGKRITLRVTFNDESLPPVRMKYPEFEEIEYEVIGGLVLMELARNHLPMLLERSPSLIRYGHPKNLYKPAVVVTHVIPDSCAQRARVIHPGRRLKELNGVKIHDLDDVRIALQKSVKTGFVHVRCDDGNVAVFSLAQILLDEPRLSQIYRYPISQSIISLMPMAYDHEQKKTRLIGPFSFAPSQPN